MVMKRCATRWALIGTLVALAPQIVGANSTVRGRLIRVGPQGTYPAVGVAVTVYSQQNGRSNPSYSGPDGMYYLYNIPPGSFSLQVWATKPPMVFQVQVSAQGFTDIAPIRVP